MFFLIGALWAIRTPDPQLRRLLLYPAELRAPDNIYVDCTKKAQCQRIFSDFLILGLIYTKISVIF